MTDQSSEQEHTTANQRRRFAFSGIEQRTLQRLRSLGLRRGSGVVVGFSGGGDSLVLAAILGRIAGPAAIDPLLVHVNHRLRPRSGAEAEHARALAADLRLPVEVVTPEIDLVTVYPGVGLEEAARRGRYLALAMVARRRSTDLVATAHHENDQAETVLLHLLRGSGLTGAAAMRDLTSLVVPWWPEADREVIPIRVWRPLLREPKSEIERYLETLGLEPNLDDSNVDQRFQRNAIRHDVLPAIERVFPAARQSLGRFAEIAGDEDALLDDIAGAAHGRALTRDKTLVLENLRAEPVAIQRRVVLRWLRDRTGTSEISLERVMAVTELMLNGREGAGVEVAAGHTATILGDELAAGTDGELEELAWSRFPGPRIAFDVTEPIQLSPAGDAVCGGVRFRAGERPPGTGEPGRDWVRLPPPSSGAWTVRRVRPGDRFAGGGGLREWLRKHRVPVLIRRDIVCLADGEAVAGIPGLLAPGQSGSESDEADLYVSWSRA